MRTFIAINLSEEERNRVQRAARALRTSDYPIRWVSPENVHLTLKFLGEVEERRAAELGEAVERAVAGADSFEMTARGFGAFPSNRRPRVVWVGIEADERLSALFGKLESELEALGFEPETRTFKPHLTLGRARRKAGGRDFDGFEERVTSLEYEDRFGVRSVDLMRSVLKPGGAEYSIVHAARLKGR